MYIPDRTFMKEMKQLDSRLGVKFNGNHFVITYDRGHGEPVNVHVVKGDDGGFRQPDRRDMEALHEGDMSKQRLKDRLDRVSKYYEDTRENLKKKFRQELKDRTKDDKIQLQQAFAKAANASKSNSAFRRVTPKRKHEAAA